MAGRPLAGGFSLQSVLFLYNGYEIYPWFAGIFGINAFGSGGLLVSLCDLTGPGSRYTVGDLPTAPSPPLPLWMDGISTRIIVCCEILRTQHPFYPSRLVIGILLFIYSMYP